MRPIQLTGYTSGQRADARAMLAALLAAVPTTKTEADQRARATVATLADALDAPQPAKTPEALERP